MGARSNFRHHAAKGAVRLLLPRDALRQYAAVRGDQRRRRFVAARFKAQYDRRRRHGGFPASRVAPRASAMTAPRIRLGTRASPLALAQAHMVRSEEHTSELQSLMRISYA